LAHTFASFSLGREPKARVATFLVTNAATTKTEGFLKTYNMPPFLGNKKVLVAIEHWWFLGWRPNFFDRHSRDPTIR
jgi:hypothetical protein